MEAILGELRADQRSLIKQVSQICWYMRGGVTWEEAWRLDAMVIKIMVKLINENIERTSKSGLALL